MKAAVYITLKPGILDPQGQATAATLSRLGFSEVADVRVGKYIELELDAADRAEATARLEKMCQQLLANTVIESYRITVEGD